jgi:hypothetical protein
MSKLQKRLLLAAAATGAMAFALSGQAARADLVFTPGDLVVSVEGDGSGTGSYGDNEAAPLTLYEFTTTGMNQTPVGSLELPQTMSGSQFPVSGEYGSSSEATLQLSGNGKYLAIAGYGVNANAFNADPAAFGPDPTNTALGQSGSLTGKSYTPVPRVAALINIDGSISSSTALSNIFDQNNPRSVYTVDGTSFYVSGQGNYPDSTGGVFYATLGSHSATSITGNDAGGGTSQDTRTVLVYNNTLYVSSDSKKGSTNRDYIGTLSPAGGPLPTSVANSGNGPAMLPGFGNSGGTGKVTISKVGGVSNGNTVNAVGDQINLSPSNFFFANADTLYVADTGSPKNTSATSPLGDGGLQKWSFKSGSWTLDYTLSVGLNLVPNSDASGSTGLYGLTGEVVDGGLEVELFATNYTITDTGQTWLYGVTDVLADKSNPGNEDFSQLAMAPADSNFKGVSFAPTSFGVITVPEPSTWAMMLIGFAGLGFGAFRRAKTAVRVPFGNELVLLDRSKGRLATDADGRVIGAEPRRSHDDDEQTC